MLNAHKRDIAKAELDKLRKAAKIDYVAPYAEAKPGAKDSGHVVGVAKDEKGEPVAEQGLFEKALSAIK